jgi:nitrite reductase/ring-hydroxylating ferredoxin subunit
LVKRLRRGVWGMHEPMGSDANGRRQLTPMEPLVEAVERAEPLDPLAQRVAKTVREAIPGGSIKDAISGTWLGHALHPMLTDVVIGSFTSATLLDLLGGDDDGAASERLIAIGIAAYGPTALSGVNDWADAEPADDSVRRVGLVHATTNTVALSLYVASLAARRRGARRRGALLGALGAAVLGGGGYLGGHLSLAKGVGPDQTVFDAGPTDWTPAGDASEVTADGPTRFIVDDTPVLVLREGNRILAIHDRCSHRGCSLSDGEIAGEEVRCACHGSRFDLRDGSVRRGPATAAQPAFEAREREGRLELRLRHG